MIITTSRRLDCIIPFFSTDHLKSSAKRKEFSTPRRVAKTASLSSPVKLRPQHRFRWLKKQMITVDEEGLASLSAWCFESVKRCEGTVQALLQKA